MPILHWVQQKICYSFIIWYVFGKYILDDLTRLINLYSFVQDGIDFSILIAPCFRVILVIDKLHGNDVFHLVKCGVFW